MTCLRTGWWRFAGTLLILLLAANLLSAAELPSGGRSLTDRSIEWPTWPQWRRLLLLQDFNTRIVLLGATMLGLASGMIGSFTLLRRRALMGDALAHATLPGIGLAFLFGHWAWDDGKSLPLLLLGAAIAGVLGVFAILFIRRYTRIKEDAAMGIVLSVFFGVGMALLGVTQHLGGNAAGLESFIYGKTASMVSGDALLIGVAGLVISVLCLLLFTPLKVLCFDQAYASTRGLPVLLLDVVLMAMVVLVTIIGLQAVGLVLMIALLVIPAAAARFWTENMWRMMLVSAALGAVSAMIGAAASAVFPRLPSGAMIVVVAAFFFMLSMFFGSARGVLVRSLRRRRLNAKVQRDHLMRGIYELLESTERPVTDEIAVRALLQVRSWTPRELRRQIALAAQDGMLSFPAAEKLQLTDVGAAEATRLVREHRLWEMYLITHADIAPSHVDRDADMIEHVLDADMIARLEQLLIEQHPDQADVVRSPHPVLPQAGGAL